MLSKQLYVQHLFWLHQISLSLFVLRQVLVLLELEQF